MTIAQDISAALSLWPAGDVRAIRMGDGAMRALTAAMQVRPNGGMIDRYDGIAIEYDPHMDGCDWRIMRGGKTNNE